MVLSGRLELWRSLLRCGVGIGVSGWLCLVPVQAREAAASPPPVSLNGLPAEAQTVHRQIRAGGPFVFPKDGIVFANRERRLPPEPRGFYREYTVATPGLRSRGGRRMVCGGLQPAAPQACYYTADHYQSFQRITP